MKSIKAKILVAMILTVAVSLSLVGGVSCYLGYYSTQQTLEDSMREAAVIASERVAYQLREYQTIAKEAGMLTRMSNAEVSLADKQEILQQKVDVYGLQRYNLLDENGVSLIDGKDYSHREYCQQALKGNVWVSEPLISSITNEITVIVAAPVWEGGDVNGKVCGVVYFVPQETFLNDIVSSMQISEGGSAYILDSQGNTIAYPDMEHVINQENTIRDAQTDSSLAALAAIESKMIAGEAGFGKYPYEGHEEFSAYAPIPDSNGWSFAISAPVSDFNHMAIVSIYVTLGLLAVAILVSVLISLRLALGIGTPIKACAQRLELLAQGDLDTPIPEFDRKDEVGVLVSSTRIIVTALSTIIKDIDHALGAMSQGNFQVESQARELYLGNFTSVLASMRQIRNRLSDTLTQIHTSADQISSGASQVSDGAQVLAQGATEQASAVEELTATVHEIADSTRKTATVSRQSQSNAEQAGGEVIHSNELMEQMTAAMRDIRESSKQIANIITTIEDIAFQTNILALNAAVEAARAGSAGKGFAVVADEVRNLASKSDQAAKATKELIESSVKSVENGNTIMNEVTEALHRTTDLTGHAVKDIVEVAGMVENVATAIAQVTEGLDQISSVVQTNSATSEQSAAASEELSSQAQLLDSLINQFQLLEHTDYGSYQ